MTRLGIVLLLVWIGGCGEKPDELTPYVEKLEPLQKYSETFAQYYKYLKTEGMTDKARDVEQVMQRYKADLEAMKKPEEKHLRALHNSMIRALDNAMRKLVEPNFPTFVPNARKAILLVDEQGVKMINNLRKMWKEAGKAEPFPLKWTKVEE